jgi:hypothetical protein
MWRRFSVLYFGALSEHLLERTFGKCKNVYQDNHQLFRDFIRVMLNNKIKQNATIWDVAPCRSFVNRHFGGRYRFHLQGRKIRERGTSVSRWLQSLQLVPRSLIFLP